MNTPISWNEIDSCQLAEFQQLDSANIKILKVFTAPHAGGFAPIIFYDYGHVGNDFIDMYDKHLTTMTKIDRFIDGDPNDANYEDTATDKPIFHNHFTNNLGCFYVCVMKHFLQENVSTYTIQAFLNKNNQLLMGQTSIYNFNEQNPINDLNNNELFNNILTCLIDL